MPSVYITGPTGIEASSSDRIIQRGDLLMIDWGVGFLDFYTDMKRVAYVLRDGETEPPAGIRHAFERAMAGTGHHEGVHQAGTHRAAGRRRDLGRESKRRASTASPSTSPPTTPT